MATKIKSASFFAGAALFLALSFFHPQSAAAAEKPEQSIQAFVDKMRAMVFPVKDAALQQKLTTEADAYLDLDALSKRALDQHWQAMSSDQQKSFLDLMQKLIENVAYPKSSKFIGNFETLYPQVSAAGNGFDVHSVIKQKEEGLDAQVIYHVYAEGDHWKIDDVVLDGVSITEDLKYQFDKIIQQSNFEGLLDTMQKRLADAQKENSIPLA